MRKLLIWAVLVSATPAMAAVNFTAVPEAGAAAIYYDATGEGELVRAFALDITVDSGATITAITDYKEGVSVSGDKGYGIFPGSIDINEAGEVNDVGTPIADPCQLPSDTLGGLGTGGITIEMGSLYAEAVNAPDPCGLLCKVEVDVDCNLTIAENVSRGKVVMEGGGQATTNLPIVVFVMPGHPDFTIAGNVASGAEPIKDLEGVTMNGLPGDPVTDIYGDYTATVTVGWSGTVTPTKTQWSIPAKVYTNVQADMLNEDYTATATECYNASAPGYAYWASKGMPTCWCCRRQCRCDTNCSSFLGKPVTVSDIELLKMMFGQIVLPPNGECADVDHDGFLGRRVTIADNDICKLYFGLPFASVPECPSEWVNEWTD